MTIDSIIRQYDFNLEYARILVKDLTKEQMTTVPGPGLVNHPAFTLGHLISGSAGMAEDLGGHFEMTEQWKELFLRKGPGDPRLPDPDAEKYPAKSQLLKELDSQHERVKFWLRKKTRKQLMEPVQWRFSSHMPTLLDLTVFMCINHEAMHLGQLAAWRRAMGLKSVLQKL
jgi:uncharacterized damage-inducible protein DinB